MMIDYNVSDHWSADEPAWVMSLVSSLDRHHGSSTVLPLTVMIKEIVSWVELASGPDAWRSAANRCSLQLDLTQSVGALGSALRAEVDQPLSLFQAAFDRLITSSAAVLKQPPGMRTDVAWTDVIASAQALLSSLGSDSAVGASWDDLIVTARNRALEGREYRPIAELFFDQLRRRGLEAEQTFRHIIAAVAFGRDPADIPIVEKEVPLDEQIAQARSIACTPATVEPIVVWLGYQGRVFAQLMAGRVTILNAHWAVPNAQTAGQEFEHKAELWELVQHGSLFNVATRVDEESDVDFLVRVDLGETTAAGAVTRATEIASTILNVSIHNAGGVRPHLAQYGVVCSGRVRSASFGVSRREAGCLDDHYGAAITSDAIEEFGPRIAEALAREELPRFLAAALEVQMTADRPFGRDMALRKPSDADIRSMIPLADRVVQHVAAHAALGPNDLFELLGERWPHARWLVDIRRAVHMCLLGGGQRQELLNDLTREWFANKPTRPWILFVADRAADLRSLCRIEHERAWIARMFASVWDLSAYRDLVDAYTAEGAVLEARRRRVRNALVHGNPVSFAVVQSVREYTEFISRSALNLGLESYVQGTAPAAALTQRTGEFAAMHAGQDAAGYWRGRLAGEDLAG